MWSVPPQMIAAGRGRQEAVQLSVGVVALPLAVKPNCVEPPAPSEPLYDKLRTVTLEPLVVSVPFQSWVIDWPLASVQVTVQAAMGEPPAVTVTLPWKPPCHELTVWYVALHPPLPPVERLGDADGLADCDGDADADGLADRDGDADALGLADAVAVGEPDGGYGALLARLYARSGWKEPAAYLQPSASPGGLIHRYPSTLASPVFSVG